MQGEIEARKSGLSVQILGVNLRGASDGNGEATSGVDLPWLQDTMADTVWELWKIHYRDMVILDGDNHPVGVYNLTEHSLALEENFDSLMTLILAAADTSSVVDTTGSEDTTSVDTLLAADFSIPDVNPNSARYEEEVSPRDYLARLSAWYFGHST